MLSDLNLLSAKQLISMVLNLNRENQCLNTELLRYKLITKCYEKLFTVLQPELQLISHKNTDEISELRTQLNALKTTQVCEIKLNILESNNSHEVEEICSPDIITSINHKIENITAILRENNNLKRKLIKESDDDLTSLCSGYSNSVKYSSDTECDEEIDPTKKKRKRKVSNKVIYTCDYNGCGRTFSELRNFRNHKALHTNFIDTEEKVWKCEFDGCNYATVIKHLYSRHRKIHSTRTRYKCDYNNCSSTVTSKDYLHQHKLTQHPELFPEIKEIKCDFNCCNYTSKCVKRINRHKRTHFSFRCDKCHKKFATLDVLNEHIVKHNQKGKYVCKFPNCDQSFAIGIDLEKHGYTHKKFKCDWDGCDKRFKTRSHLKYHILVVHRKSNRKTIYYCDWNNCGKKFSNITVFREHKNIHTGNKPFKCEWPGCDKSFPFKLSLRNHRLLHTNTGSNKLYHCSWPECSYGTNNKYNLNKHNDIHSGFKKHACDWPECGFSASNKSNLNTHKKSHIL